MDRREPGRPSIHGAADACSSTSARWTNLRRSVFGRRKATSRTISAPTGCGSRGTGRLRPAWILGAWTSSDVWCSSGSACVSRTRWASRGNEPMIAPATRATSDRDVSTESPTAQRRSLGAYLLEATAANWIASLLSIVYALFITPIVIKALNKDLYGVWSFLNGLLAYSSLLYVGLGAAFIKYLSQYRAVGDRVSVTRLASA